MSELSHFDEKSGCVTCPIDCGWWYQTLHEIHLNVNVPKGTKAKNLSISILPSYLKCELNGTIVIAGKFKDKIVPDESTWSLEDGERVCFLLTKMKTGESAVSVWPSLFEDNYKLDPMTLLEVRKKIDLEKMQIEHPGMDFSGATFNKVYDDLIPEGS